MTTSAEIIGFLKISDTFLSRLPSIYFKAKSWQSTYYKRNTLCFGFYHRGFMSFHVSLVHFSKNQTLLNIQGAIPTYISLTPAAFHDVQILDILPLFL
jgi:hypothetical protein